MSDTIVFSLIKQILHMEDRVYFTKHALKRMIERSISRDDVRRILTNPDYIRKEVESETHTKKINYRIMGYDGLSVVVSIHTIPNEKIIVVTVID